MPIVIKVLEIVSVFAIATLLISYILFKIRQKTNPAKAEQTKELTPKFVDRGIKKITQITREILPSSLPKVKNNHPIQSSRRNESSYQNQKIQTVKKCATNSREKDIEKRIRIENSPNKSADSNPKRVEIMNNFPIQPEKELKPKPKTDLNTLGNDIIEKYTDDNDTNFYTLKTNKKESK